MDLDPYAPFTLAALAPRQSAVLEWDGEQRHLDPHPERRVPLISSSFDPGAVRAHRRAQFPEAPSPETLYLFHTSHRTQPGPYSTCMHRDDARTVSFSWIRVRDGSIEFSYSPDAPCHRAPASLQTLTRRRA